MFKILPCIDSVEIAASRRQELDITRDAAAELGRSALKAAVECQYVYGHGRKGLESPMYRLLLSQR